MKLRIKHTLSIVLGAALVLPLNANATNGYFAIGYGPNSRGIAGAGTALPQDALAAASNPAGMGAVGHRGDISLELFSPIREADSAFGGGALSSDSDSNYFLVPSGGYVKPYNNQTSLGISVYANGGMNTNYDPDNGGVNLFGSGTSLGVNLAQLVFAPTIAHKLNNNHIIGASLLLGYQRFKAHGLQNFCGLKASGCGTGPGSAVGNSNLTNQGSDDAFGWGLRVGYLGKLSPNVTVGAAYSSKIYMNEFDKYDELFAEQGDFDIPANWSVGIAIKANAKTTVTFDVQRIEYGDIRSIANTGPALTGLSPFGPGSGLLGTDNGLGFGWDDMTIAKLGVVYDHDSKWTWRFGVSHGSQPIDNDELTFNILAPAVIETHITAGFSYRPTGKPNNEWTLTYMHAVNNSESGDFPQAFGGTPGADQTRLEMYQHAFELGYAWKF